LLRKEQEEPDEALEEQGEVEMTEANTDLVQKQLSELAQQIVHVIEACNDEKNLLDEDFEWVKNGITIMESRLQTKKSRTDSEVPGVGHTMQFQQAILDELRLGVHILQEQDNQIVGEATNMFQGIRAELEAQNKKNTDNGLQIFAQKVSIQAVQKSIGLLSNRIDEINTVLASITESRKQIPSKRDIQQHQVAMNETLVQIAEVNPGLTTAMEQYKFSESTPFAFQQSVARPSGTQPYMDPRRAAALNSPSVSSLRNTGSEYSWHARIRGGAGSEGTADGAAGGADTGNGNADNGNAGNRGAGGGGPPPPPPPPPDGGAGDRRMSRRQRRHKEFEFTKPIKIKEPINFFRNGGEDFDTWWILIQVYIEGQPEKFPKDEITIDWTGSLMKGYAAFWHIQWIKGTLSGAHPKSMTGYVNALKLRFEDKDAQDEAYADMEEVRYEGCIRDMFTKIQTFNDKAKVSGAAMKKIILQRLPQEILEQMHTVDLTEKTDQELYAIITSAGRTAEKWEAAWKILGIKASMKTYEKKHHKLEGSKEKTESRKFNRRSRKNQKEQGQKEQGQFKNNRKPKDYGQTEGIQASEIARPKSAGECSRCAWPSDRKGTHRVKDCRRPIKLEKGMASLPKAKEYQKMKIAGMELFSDDEESSDSSEEDSEEEDSEQDDSEEENSEEEDSDKEESEVEYFEKSGEEEEEEQEEERNWWDLPPESD